MNQKNAAVAAETRSGKPSGMTSGLPVAIDAVRAGYRGGPTIVGKHDPVTLHAQPGTVTCLLGPNGCGKSTLLKTVNHLLAPSAGEVRVGEKAVAAMKPREIAQHVALLPQSPVAPEGLLVYELVSRGRHPHRGRFGGNGPQDLAAIEAALDATDTALLAETPVEQLSGGQRQRVWLAMALAQETPVLLLDEPTTYLDPAHAMDMLELARAQARAGRTVIMVLHDVMLAGQYSDELVLMHDGAIHATGAPKDVLTPTNLKEVYGMDAEVWDDAVSPVIVPRGRPPRP